jgi:hypothetical protein
VDCGVKHGPTPHGLTPAFHQLKATAIHLHPAGVLGFVFYGFLEGENSVHEGLVIEPAVEVVGRRKDAEGVTEGWVRGALTTPIAYEQPIDSRCKDSDLRFGQPKTNLSIDLGPISSHAEE